MLYIFDWDGTLSNSIPKIVASVQQSAAQMKLPEKSYQEAQQVIGLGLRIALKTRYPDLNKTELDEFVACYSETYLRLDKDVPSPFYQNVLETLRSLRDQGHHLAVATGKSRKGLDRVLMQHDVNNLFVSTRCADESGSKPDPAMLLEILREREERAEQAVMIGDTEFDMEMAHAISMPRIAVSYGAHGIDRLRCWQPLACLDDFAELCDVAIA